MIVCRADNGGLKTAAQNFASQIAQACNAQACAILFARITIFASRVRGSTLSKFLTQEGICPVFWTSVAVRQNIPARSVWI